MQTYSISENLKNALLLHKVHDSFKFLFPLKILEYIFWVYYYNPCFQSCASGLTFTGSGSDSRVEKKTRSWPEYIKLGSGSWLNSQLFLILSRNIKNIYSSIPYRHILAGFWIPIRLFEPLRKNWIRIQLKYLDPHLWQFKRICVLEIISFCLWHTPRDKYLSLSWSHLV